jgi:hypothetical protein
MAYEYEGCGVEHIRKVFFKDPLAGVFLATGGFPISSNRDIYEVFSCRR